MKAVARLFAIYWTGTAAARIFTATGLPAIIVGTVLWIVYRPNIGRHSQGITPQVREALGLAPAQDLSLAVEFAINVAPFLGLMALLLGSSLAARIVPQLASSRQMHVLPRGRVKLFGSALLTVATLACVTALTTLLLIYVDFYGGPLPSIGGSFVSSFTLFSFIYVGLWVIGRFQGALAVLTGLLLLIWIGTLATQLAERVASADEIAAVAVGGLWSVLCVLILATPRVRAATAALRFGAARARGLTRPGEPHDVGRRAVELALGTAHPWRLALGLVVPIAAAALFVRDASVRAYYLALFAAILGGYSSLAVARSRPLWLRADVDRTLLFTRVERAHWRTCLPGLAVLVLCHVALGLRDNLAATSIGAGFTTLVLGTGACLYLGLLTTRGLRWPEIVAVLGTLALFMVAAAGATVTAAGSVLLNAGATVSAPVLVGMNAALLGLAVAFRYIAQRRWTGLDWTLARGAGAGAARATR